MFLGYFLYTGLPTSLMSIALGTVAILAQPHEKLTHFRFNF